MQAPFILASLFISIIVAQLRHFIAAFPISDGDAGALTLLAAHNCIPLLKPRALTSRSETTPTASL